MSLKQGTHLAQGLIIVAGVVSKSGVYLPSAAWTWPSSRNRANHLNLSRPDGYGTHTAGNFQQQRPRKKGTIATRHLLSPWCEGSGRKKVEGMMGNEKILLKSLCLLSNIINWSFLIFVTWNLFFLFSKVSSKVLLHFLLPVASLIFLCPFMSFSPVSQMNPTLSKNHVRILPKTFPTSNFASLMFLLFYLQPCSTHSCCSGKLEKKNKNKVWLLTKRACSVAHDLS